MADSALFDLPAAEAAPCPRCGRLFEVPVEIEGDDGRPRKVHGHVQGDPRLCVPVPTVEALIERDARRRRDKRRGRASKGDG